ncbi:hypothetical protein JYU34_015739 [Plutella xylostella]|uniref:Ubiquitin-like modifier-activating enzyme ATG7 n=1 Tax=Plutella xylostella TaxID=51655 RepID=A0ABQ7Q4L3_PLUXY|nr:hypothetical protein JYU34_015739 [Plutella xylostella]
MTDTGKEEIIQYVPFMSFVHPSFWHTLTEMKLDVDKLNESTKQIFGRFSYRDDINAVFEVDGTSFNSSPEIEQLYENVTGTIVNKNTVEEFKSIDKASLLNSMGEMIWANVKNKTWIDKPNILLNFFILSFADLKKFHYYYWFAFPAPSQPTVYLKERSKIDAHFDKKQVEQLIQQHKSLELAQKSFFIVVCSQEGLIIKTIGEVLDKNEIVQSEIKENLSEMYFGFLDPSNGENPGWTLRLYVAALLEHCPSLRNTALNMLGLRFNIGGVENSYVFTLRVPEDVKSTESAGWVGWERNDRGNFGPKLANMSASMDPIKLADTSSDLNIKLMKWRLVPDLNVNVMKETKCLLLGAGTLGCHVARDLLAWGFRHITFVDSGAVSHSNPTRQVLFTFRDAASGKGKAFAAATSLKEILPTVHSEGIRLHIPMPGHPVGASMREETVANIEKLTQAIESHDVIFLLLDTREARWLPTLIAAHFGKIVLNAALGFDSYLVMRHGVHPAPGELGAGEGVSGAVAGGQLGCYFCNDVTAPGNSLKDRTLDQQCTVTRPGVAAVAGALAVEVLVGLLQHPLRVEAPAICNLQPDDEIPASMQGVLGPIPHSIRGFLHTYQNVLPTCTKFKQCIACSDAVIDKYRAEGTEFVLKVCDSGKYLEEVTGLSELHLAAEMQDVLMFSDEEDEDED